MKNNITAEFEQLFVPSKALLIYDSLADENENYVEAYDIDEQGYPINAHPLSVQEAILLAKGLMSTTEPKRDWLQCSNLLPDKLLYTNSGSSGFAIWYTPCQKVNLFFKEKLGIPCGTASIPGLIWKADRDNLSIFAYKQNARPNQDTCLFYAPFFNTHPDGEVCMGTVDIDFSDIQYLEDFMQHWEDSFFNSYFSHTIEGHLPTKSNIVQLWQALIGSNNKFPENTLIKTHLTLKSLML